jgi:site-specific recombinase XerD
MRAVEWMVRKYARAAGIRKKITPHVFRGTTATAMLRAGANVRHVQEVLGHRTVATLGPYLELTITEIEEAHRRYHPRERTGP